jgi:dihydrofolate reductase
VSRTQYFTAASLDGFLADENGSLDWLFRVPHGEGEGRWKPFFSQVGAMAMGAMTYRWAVEHEKLLENPESWRGFYGDVPCWIFTRGGVPLIPGADLRVVSGDVAAVHRDMSSVAGERNIWIVGGGDLVGQFHDSGLLDDILISIAPVTLGAGAPLLPRHIEGMRVASVSQDGQRVDIHYTLDDVPKRR